MSPKGIVLLPNRKTFDLSRNMPLSGTSPEFPIDKHLKSLVFMLLEFYGEIPDSIGNLQFFHWTGLKESYFLWIDTFFSSLTHLIHLKLSCNKLLGWIPFLPPLKKGPRLLDTINHVGLANPGSLSTESSSMEATLNSSLFELPSLERLLPSQNRLSGVLQDFWRAYLSPWVLLISINNFEGHLWFISWTSESYWIQAFLQQLQWCHQFKHDQARWEPPIISYSIISSWLFPIRAT